MPLKVDVVGARLDDDLAAILAQMPPFTHVGEALRRCDGVGDSALSAAAKSSGSNSVSASVRL